MLVLLVLILLFDVGYAPKGHRESNHTKRMILTHLARNADPKQIAIWFGLSTRTILRYKARYSLYNGTLDYKPRRSGRKSKWDDNHTEIAKGIISRNSAIYLGELRQYLYNISGDIFSISTIWRKLRANRLSNKVLTRRFSEANPWVELSFWDCLSRNNTNINQFMWFDESYICRLSGNRKRGWSLMYESTNF